MNELKQPLNQEQIPDQSINSTCCYFDIYCGKLYYYICSGFCLLAGVSI